MECLPLVILIQMSSKVSESSIQTLCQADGLGQASYRRHLRGRAMKGDLVFIVGGLLLLTVISTLVGFGLLPEEVLSERWWLLI